MKLETSQLPMSKKILKLVVVLYKLQQGLSVDEVREQMQLERLVDQTNSICKEGSKDLNLSQDVISVSSLKLSSLMSPHYPSKDKNLTQSLFQ